MTSLSPKPVLLDDIELIQGAATPRVRLFPILSRASAFAPLILVCCVLPALQLLAQTTLGEEGSLWGLRSLAVANATTWAQLREPGLNEQGQPLLYQPPFSAWLNAVVFRILGPAHLLSAALVSLVATGIAIALTTRLAWRIGGSSTALMAALLMCIHPQVLEFAITPGGNAIGLCLLLLSVYEFQRHLERTAANVSLSLVISGIAFGLSLLTVGSLALILPLLYMCHALSQRTGPVAGGTRNSFRIRLAQRLSVLRSTFVLTAIGFLIGGWWEIVMGVEYGGGFWRAWWSNLPVVCQSQGTSEFQCDLVPLAQPTWREWLHQNVLLIGWMLVGLERSWHEIRNPSSELAWRRHQLLMSWWMIGLSGRVLAEIAAMRFHVNTAMWDLALLAPTILMATIGIGTLIERGMSRRGEFCLIVLLVGLTIVRATTSCATADNSDAAVTWTDLTTFSASTSWATGLAGMVVVAAFLVFAPMLIPSLGRSEGGWSERGWRRLLQITVYTSLAACFSVGVGLQYSTSADKGRLAQLRDQMAALPDVHRVTCLVTSDPGVPVTLRYLLRCRWPKAEIVTSDGWDAGLTRAMNEESSAPRSRFLILEWTRRDVRLSADTGQSWQISPVGDPMRFRGRKLSMILIAPRT